MNYHRKYGDDTSVGRYRDSDVFGLIENDTDFVELVAGRFPDDPLTSDYMNARMALHSGKYNKRLNVTRPHGPLGRRS
jgi:hypothetical protein